ncbi:Nipped-B-like protein B [Durusdinium trenchii]|uniref:Nipped-B-like protein B n=1 Tax=Durusdinium trenchii TaxID=1381693 RepID=A0ABP0QY91_9DINO
MKHATMGEAPAVGFENEAFAEKSFRGKLAVSKALAKNWRACYFSFKADLKARHEIHGFKNWYQCAQICESCMARKDVRSPPGLNFRNFDPNSAAWMETMIDHPTFIAMGGSSPWQCMEGWTLATTTWDWMHNVYLGVGRDLLGSGLRLLIERGVFGPNPRLNEVLSEVQAQMVRDCRQRGLPLPKKPALAWTSIGGDDDYCEMSSKFKAVHIKRMVWWLAFKSQEAADSNMDDRVLQTFATCAYALQRCIEIQDGGGLVLSLEEAEECYSSLILHLRTYSWLASFHWEERRLLFRMRPKHHILYHQALQLKEWRINQSVFHCFDQESFLGKIKNICQKCHGRSATRQIYNRYLLCVAMMLEQHRRIVS